MKKLSKEEQLECLDTIVAASLDRYILLYKKLRRSGLTPKEIVSLRGLPLNKQELINKINNDEIELIDIDGKTSEMTIKNIKY